MLSIGTRKSPKTLDRLGVAGFCDRVCFLSLCGIWIFIPFSIAGVEINFTIALIAYLAKKVASRDRTLPFSKPILILMTLFLVSVGISFLRSDFFSHSFRGYIRWWKALLLLVITAETVASNGRVLKITKLLMIMFSIASLDGIIQLILGYDLLRFQPPVISSYGTMIRAGFGHYNNYSAYLATLLPIAIAAIKYPSNSQVFWRVLTLLAVILGNIALWLTSSRSGIVGVLCSAVVIGFLFRQRIFLAYICVFLFFIFVKWAGWTIVENIQSHGFLRNQEDGESKQASEASADILLFFRGPSGRIQMWQEALQLSKERPFFGYGPNTFMQIKKSYETYAHNSYIQILLELGYVGLILFVAVVGCVLKEGVGAVSASKNKADFLLLTGILGGVGAFLIHSLFDHDLYVLVLAALFWSFLGLASARASKIRLNPTVD